MKSPIAFLCLLMLATLSTAHAHAPIATDTSSIYFKMSQKVFDGNINAMSMKMTNHRNIYLNVFDFAYGKYRIAGPNLSYKIPSPRSKRIGNDHNIILSEKKEVRYV